ncbi:MAG: transcriptional regulator [Spirochaetaceae bacterium]|nr:MAG: transcriptional regulator [Spirochaetaceae bacterium]
MKNTLRAPTRGVIIGRFMPPHLGHRYLVGFAREFVEHLTVLVCTLQDEPIPGKLRYEWMQAMFCDVEIIHVTEEIPEANRNNPNSYRIWADFIRKIIPDPIDYVFASEQYGFKLAAELAAEFVPVDPGRNNFPVSATEIRKDPFSNWVYLPNLVKPYFARRVACISQQVGVPGVDSHPAHGLARHYDTVCVSDALERWMTMREKPRSADDVRLVMKSQAAATAALLPLCNRVLFAEADCITLQARFNTEGLPQSDCADPSDLYILHYDSTHSDTFRQYMDTVTSILEERRLPFVVTHEHDPHKDPQVVTAIEKLFVYEE